MNHDLTPLLKELYKLDPSLEEHEQDLIPILKSILAHKPDVTPDKAFAKKLRSQLNKRAKLLEAENTQLYSPSFFSFLNMPKFSYAIAGVVVGIIAAVPASYLYFSSSPDLPFGKENSPPLFSYSITDASDRAFGDLGGVPAVQGGRGEGGGGGVPAGLGGGGDGAAADAMIASPRIMPPESIVQFEYSYEGELPPLPETVSVLRRERGLNAPSLNQVADTFKAGMLDLQSFSPASVESIILSQDSEFGYTVSFQMKEGTMGIYQNWQRWPHPEQNCRDEQCFRSFQLKISDIPSDDVILGITKAFVEKHAIDLSPYGEPEIDLTWKREYDRVKLDTGTQPYVPDTIRVIYPLMMEGKPVFDQGGTKAGMSIGVNVRHKRVSEAWGISNQNYLRSNYEGITDSGAIRSYISSLERYPIDTYPAGTKISAHKVELGEPELGFAIFYISDANEYGELIIPSLIFPVKQVEQNQYFYRTSVTIPLAKELFEKFQNPGGVRPLMQ